MKKIIIILILLLIPVVGKAEELSCDCLGEALVIGNGREFFRQDDFYSFYNKNYPLYEDSNGIKAYFEGMLILELKSINKYDSSIAWSVNADDFTTYHDLGITLLEFDSPAKAEDAYYKLLDSNDPGIIYIELALIELD